MSFRIHTLVVIACLWTGCAQGGQVQAKDAADVGADPVEATPAAELFERGRALAARGDHVRAEQYLAAAVARGYPKQQALPLLLRTCVASSRLGAALAYVRPYLRDNPNDAVLRYLMASVLMGLDRHDEARTELTRVVQERPDFAPAHYVLGLLESEVFADRAAARVAFERYLELERKGRHAAEVVAWLRQHPERLAAERAADLGTHDSARVEVAQ